MDRLFGYIDRLYDGDNLCSSEYEELIKERSGELLRYASEKASEIRDRIYGKNVFVRGLIEFTNYCKNDCYYCGIRRSNKCAERYRLADEEITECCENGYALGFRTFVLQGGEDMFFTDEKIVSLIKRIKSRFPDCAVTLSIGERERESYRKFLDAGADRFLLRHETADNGHYGMLHPKELSPEHRKRCLRDLKEIGFQTGSGFMVGSPYQTEKNLADDLIFLRELSPEMVGIGPFIPHKDTPFKDKAAGTLELTLFMLALTRLTLHNALIPATTALGTVAKDGREMGVLAGANVVMPNLSPESARKKYMLYDNKLSSGSEAAEHLSDLKTRMKKIGFDIPVDRGDYRKEE